MRNLTSLWPESSPNSSVMEHASDREGCSHCGQDGRTDHQFVAMLNSYRASGGLARAQEVVAMFKRREGPDVATLKTWIACREVICFEWESQSWLPWFQFKVADMQPHQDLGKVLTELTPVYDPWELANWFSRPNPWLSDQTPVDTIALNLPDVLNAARAARFIGSY